MGEEVPSLYEKLKTVEDPVEKEVLQLQRRYNDAFNFVDSEGAPASNSKSVFIISGFQTTDPDFDKSTLGNGITVRFQLAKDYPVIPAVVEILSNDLSEDVKNSINQELVAFCNHKKGYLHLRSVLKWLDKRIGETKSPVAKKPEPEDIWTLSQQHALEEGLGKYPSSLGNAKRWVLIAKSVPGKSASQCIKRYKLIRSKILEERNKEAKQYQKKKEAVKQQIRQLKLKSTMHENPQVGQKKPLEEPQNVSLSPLEKFTMPELDERNFEDTKGTKCLMEGLEQTGVGWLACSSLQVQGQCLHCGGAFERTLHPGVEHKEWCKSCPKLLQVSLLTALVHEGNATKLALIQSETVLVQDVITISMSASCFECTKVSKFAKMIRGKALEQRCTECHNRLRLFIENFCLDGEIKNIQSKPDKREFTKKPKRDPRIIPGQPLPNEGTCKHYRKSHRWLRFPCCGKAFPCDVCHELESGCTEAKWATRQICGYCGREQAFTKDKPCKYCDKVIGLRIATAHWEGGKGCRDKVKMSVKDSKKYSNSKSKTTSNKSNRVGNAKKLKQKKQEKEKAKGTS